MPGSLVALAVLSLDTLDVSGNHAANVMQNINKVRLDAEGRRMADEPPPAARGSGGRERGGSPSARRLLGGSVEDEEPVGGGGGGGGGGAFLRQAQRFGKIDGGQFAGGDLLLSRLLSELLPGVFEDKEAIAELRKHVGEGCHLDGYMLVNKVAGNFHFALQKADHHVLMTVFRKRESINARHRGRKRLPGLCPSTAPR